MPEGFEPKRRGRPPMASQDAATDTAEQGSALPKRRRRASVGGMAVKLSAPLRPGYTRRWVNDINNRVAEVEELGYEHISDDAIKSTGTGTVVQRLVGTKANGEPLTAFLMECPDELYAQGVAEKEAFNRSIDDAIVSGRDSTGQMSPNETYGQGSIKSGR